MLSWKAVILTEGRPRHRQGDGRRVGQRGPSGVGAEEDDLADVIGRVAAHGVEVQGQPGGVDDLPQRVPVRVPQRLEVGRVGDVQPAQRPALGHALHLGDGRVDRMVGDRGEAPEALRMRRAEIRQPLVVDAHDLHRRLGVIEPAAGAEHAVQHFGLHAITVLILDAQVGIGEPADAPPAVLVEPRGGHAIGAMDLAGDVLAAGRAHPVHVTEVGALLRGPHAPVGPVGDVRHALPHLGRGAGREEVGR
jgi:hypothetical protein